MTGRSANTATSSASRYALTFSEQVAMQDEIAQVDENHTAVIAAHLHPAGQNDLLSDVGCCQLIAVMSPIHGEEKALILGEAQNLRKLVVIP